MPAPNCLRIQKIPLNDEKKASFTDVYRSYLIDCFWQRVETFCQ